MIASLLVSLVMLGYRAGERYGPGPLLVGAAAAGAILGGRFFLDMAPVTYGGTALLVAASIWNAWPGKQAAAPAGPRTGSGPYHDNKDKEVTS